MSKIPKGSFPAVGVPLTEKFVRVIFVDVRDGAERKQIEFIGKMVIPNEVYKGRLLTNWDFDEIVKPLRGAVTDLQPEGCTIVFPIAESCDVIGTRDGKVLTIEEIIGVFLKYHPTFKRMATK